MRHLLYFCEVRAGRRGFRERRRPAGGFARNKKGKLARGTPRYETNISESIR
jgi:hypothetical protein